jgi:tRNA(fMet)-specific endonuclease VapC
LRQLLDINICIYLIRIHPPQVVRHQQGLRLGSTVMSVVTHAAWCAGLDTQSTHPAQEERALGQLIAAHAVSVGLILVTNNGANFRGYPGLQVENWASPA